MSKTMNFINGDPVYGSTAMDVIRKEPEDRMAVVEHWLSVIGSQVQDYENPKHYGHKDGNLLAAWTYEAWKHATVALFATEEMNGRPAVDWDCTKPWQEFLSDVLNQ